MFDVCDIFCVSASLVPKTLTYSNELNGFVSLPSHFDYYRDILENPTFFIAKAAPGDDFDVYFLDQGLNSYNVQYTRPHETLYNVLRSPDDHVAVVYPSSAFPIDRFPSLENAEVVIPEYKVNFPNLLSDTPIVTLIPKEEFNEFSSEDVYDVVADIELESGGVRVARGYQPALPEIKLKYIPSATHLAAPMPFYYVYSPTTYPTLAQQVSPQAPYYIPSNVGPAPPPSYVPAVNPPRK